MNSAAQRTKALDLCSYGFGFTKSSKDEKSKASAFGGFISFDKRQKKRTKEKRFLDRANLWIDYYGRFPDSASVPRLGTAHILCAALRVLMTVS